MSVCNLTSRVSPSEIVIYEMDGEWKVMLRWIKSGVLAWVICLVIASVGLAEDLAFKAQIEKLLNLGTDITVEKFQNGDDVVALWTEFAEGGKHSVKNWGLVYFIQGNIADSWFYEGRYTNMFQRFIGSFQQFTTDGRKELALIGEGTAGTGWARVFVFNLADRKINVLLEVQNLIQPGIFEKPGESHTAGMFQDLNHDRIMEIVTYQELKGAAGKASYWPDLYSWSGKEMVLVNKKYPSYYQKLLGELERAALIEETLPTGNYRIFYEHMAKIYDIRNQAKEAAVLRERMLLPPQELGKRVQEFLRAQGYRIHQTFRTDIDGVNPLDAIVWAKTPDGSRNQVWFMTQSNQTFGEAVAVPLPASFFEPGGDVAFTVKKEQVWAFRKPTATKPGLGFLYRYDGGTRFTLLGSEEREMLTGGKVVRRVTGETYNDPELARVKSVVSPTSVINATKSKGTITIDGRFMENDWAQAIPLLIQAEEKITRGYNDWNNANDLSYSIRSLYKGNSLYFSMKVKDEIRVYATKIGVHAGWLSDHIEMYFVVKGQIHRYGIFILPTEAQAFERIGEEWKAPTYPVTAQWMPGPDGYWVEFEMSGLPLYMDAIPMTILVFDKDTADGVNPLHDTIMSTSDFKADDPDTLGFVKLQ